MRMFLIRMKLVLLHGNYGATDLLCQEIMNDKVAITACYAECFVTARVCG